MNPNTSSINEKIIQLLKKHYEVTDNSDGSFTIKTDEGIYIINKISDCQAASKTGEFNKLPKLIGVLLI
jgi:hypothetical protein